jgi:hypothetical protein
MNDLISTPIPIPIIKPADWEQWWSLWNKEMRYIPKISKNPNQNAVLWRGFDIYVKEGIDAELKTNYRAANVNCPELFPSIFNNLDKFPIDIEIVRAVSSVSTVFPHCDFEPGGISVRSMLYDNNLSSTFYYKFNNKTVYQQLPTDTNTWCFYDNKTLHGTDWFSGHSKILITYIGMKKENLDQHLLKSASQYPNYTVRS